MKKGICFLIILLGIISCQRKNTAGFHISHSRYEQASLELERGKSQLFSSVVTPSTQEVNAASAHLPVKEQTTYLSKKQQTRCSVYSQQRKDTIPANTPDNYQRKNRVKNKNADTAFIFGLLAFIPLPAVFIVLGLISMGFGIAALNEMHREPLKYKGKEKAIFGVILGGLIILGLIAMAIVIAIM